MSTSSTNYYLNKIYEYMSHDTVKLLNINSVCIICITKLFNMRFKNAYVC